MEIMTVLFVKINAIIIDNNQWKSEQSNTSDINRID